MAMEDCGHEKWGCIGTMISGAGESGVGAGYQNTIDIVAGCSDTAIAANIAFNYSHNGYDDWYLPSIDELSLINTVFGGATWYENGEPIISGDYWSSSQQDENYAVRFNFTYGYSQGYGKNGGCNIRSIRSF